LTEAVPFYLNNQADEAFNFIAPEFGFQLYANGSYNKIRYKQEKRQGSFMHKVVTEKGVSIFISLPHLFIYLFLKQVNRTVWNPALSGSYGASFYKGPQAIANRMEECFQYLPGISTKYHGRHNWRADPPALAMRSNVIMVSLNN
jgi:hypothetical protein